MENPRARLLQAHQPTKKRGWVAPASLIVFRTQPRCHVCCSKGAERSGLVIHAAHAAAMIVTAAGRLLVLLRRFGD